MTSLFDRTNYSVASEVRSVINEFRNLQGQEPGGLLLGSLIYLALCRTMGDDYFDPNYQKPTHFEGYPITIDPEHKRRITALYPGNPFDAALQSYAPSRLS